MQNPACTLSRLCAISVFFGLAVAGGAGAQPEPPGPGSWMLQSLYLTGDWVDGFSRTCLVVYRNGDFHREQRRQYSSGGRAQFEWQAPEVFEGKLTEDNLQALEMVLKDPGLAALRGVVGRPRDPLSAVVFNNRGWVIPQDNIEILTAAVARSSAPQVFEVSDFEVARKQAELGALLNWIKDVEHNPAQRFLPAQANDCSSLVAQDVYLSRKISTPMGVTFPKRILVSTPQAPHQTSTQGPQTHEASKPERLEFEVLVNPDGSVGEITPHGHLDAQTAQSIRMTISKWKFEPARLLGIPIAMTLHVRIDLDRKNN